MNSLKTVSGTVNPEPKTKHLRVGDNLFNIGTFKDICSGCMKYTDIIYVFKMPNGKILTQTCDSCFE